MALTLSSARDQLSTFYESIAQPFRDWKLSRTGVWALWQICTWCVSPYQGVNSVPLGLWVTPAYTMVLSPILSRHRKIWTDEVQMIGLRIKFSVYNSLPLWERPTSYFLPCHFRKANIWKDCSTEVILYRWYIKLYQRWPCERNMFSWSLSLAGDS